MLYWPQFSLCSCLFLCDFEVSLTKGKCTSFLSWLKFWLWDLLLWKWQHANMSLGLHGLCTALHVLFLSALTIRRKMRGEEISVLVRLWAKPSLGWSPARLSELNLISQPELWGRILNGFCFQSLSWVALLDDNGQLIRRQYRKVDIPSGYDFQMGKFS